MARRILLADDSVTAQNMGRRILHDAGYEVTTVNNGSAALKKIAELKPDLIILDVYMPGYGGLEVCSRLKENRETQRIPVLLTVGKLEPFKPEEARRVRADAYIVKPFEASELLTALTKLEDKIVPGPEPYKQGRFAKAMAAVEHSGSEKDFGDQETGWKERLIIPGGKPKAVESEPEPVPTKASHAAGRDPDFRPAEPKTAFERPIPAGLPQDISAEEIAAITAAAAKISGNRNQQVASEAHAPAAESKTEAVVETPVVESPVVEIPATAVEAAIAPAVETVEDEETPAATFASSPEAEEMASAPEAEGAPRVELAPAVPSETVPEIAAVVEAAPPAEEKRPVSDAEVLAALASLTPAGGDFSLAATNPSDPSPMVAEAVGAGAIFSGPRWIAEPLSLSDEESTFLLQHEMEKAYAAFAAADAGRAMLEVAAVVPSHANGYGLSDIAVSEPASNLEPEVKPEEPASASAEPAQEFAVAAVATDRVAPEESAYAAAASAGATEVVSEAPSGVSMGASEPVVAEDGSRVGEAELAAAWANWRQIRETIVGDQPSAQVADAEAGYKDMHAETVATPAEPPQEQIQQASAEAATETPTEAKTDAGSVGSADPATGASDPSEISSIVDSMLAELKPKLMEELKRKLGK